MNFKDLLSLGMDDILDMTEERRMQRSRKHMEEFTADSSEDGFYFEDFGGDTSLFEKFEKKEDNQEGFNLMEYGLPIVNAHHGFSYNEAYFIPYERYQEVFDSSFTIHIYFQSALQGWGGNCFGMSVVSILSYLGKISLGDYQKAEVPLPDTAYDHIISEDFGTYCCLEKDSELTKLIERYFVLQFSTSVVDLRLKSISFCENEPERMQRYLNSVRQEKIPYMLSVHWYNDEDNPAGHALVVDSAREPQNLGNGWHRIFLYDPNNPYHRFSNESPAPYYNQAGNRYIDINVITGDWHMSAIVNANPDSKSSLIGSDVEGSNASMYFVDCGSIQGDFTKKSDIHPIHLMGTQMLQYRNDFMSVYDVKGNRLCSVINGALKDCIDERIKNLPVIEAAVAGAHRECAGTLVLPDEPVVIKLKRGFIGLFSPDTYRGCVSEEAVTLCFKEEGCMEVLADFPTVVNVVMKEGEGDYFASYMTNINVSQEPCQVFLQDMNLYVNMEKDQEIDVSIITEAGVSEEKNVSVRKGVLVKARDQSRVYKKKDRRVSK